MSFVPACGCAFAVCTEGKKRLSIKKTQYPHNYLILVIISMLKKKRHQKRKKSKKRGKRKRKPAGSKEEIDLASGT